MTNVYIPIPVLKKTIIIASGASLSDPIVLPSTTDDTSIVIPVGNRIGAIQMPAAWTTAAITFQGSLDGVTYCDIMKDGTEYSVPASASQFIILSLADFACVPFLKIRSGTSGTPVAQGAGRSLVLGFRLV